MAQLLLRVHQIISRRPLPIRKLTRQTLAPLPLSRVTRQKKRKICELLTLCVQSGPLSYFIIINYLGCECVIYVYIKVCILVKDESSVAIGVKSETE